MDSIWFNIAVIAVLVVVNAAFAGTELAVITLRRGQITRLAETRGRSGRMLLALADEPTRFLSTIQVGITLAGFLASATAAVSLAEPLEPHLRFLGSAAGIIALVLVTLMLTFFTLVFGELVPKRIAMRNPERWALAAAPPVTLVARVARPVVWLLARTTDLFARLFGGGSMTDDERMLSDADVLDVIATETNITPARRALVEGALEIETRQLREVLIPRRDVLTLDGDEPAGDAARRLAVAGRSRAPVVTGGDLDRVLGTTSLARLVAAPSPNTPARELVHEAVVFPDVAHVQAALKTMQRARRQLAIVADEHGRTVGIITVEDLLEEIVGEIYDEHDRDLTPDDPRGYQQRPDGSFELLGTFPAHDLPALGLDAGLHTASTVGGLLFDALGHMPAEGEHAVVGRMRIEALDVEGTVIRRVDVRRRG